MNDLNTNNDVINLDEQEMDSAKRKKKLFIAGALLLSLIFIGVGVYAFMAGGSMDKIRKDKEQDSEMRGSKPEDLFDNGDRIHPSPINGVLHTQKQYEIFSNRRPLAIMLNNHVMARPQHGLSTADIVYEVVAEGGITRLMPIYHSQGAGQVGPVRSARVYYIDLAGGYNPFYVHWGGAYINPTDPENTTHPDADVYRHINRLGIPSLDQAYIGGKAFFRDNTRNVPLEHTGYTDTEKLWALPGSGDPQIYPEPSWREFVAFREWKFKEDTPAVERPQSATLTFNFWNVPQFEVSYEYDRESNTWQRSQGGEPTVDAGNNNKRIAPKTVIVMYATERSAQDRKAHLFYDVVGSGMAKVYMDGKEIDARWTKQSPTDREVFFDLNGNELELNRGQIWVEVLPAGKSVNFVSR